MSARCILIVVTVLGLSACAAPLERPSSAEDIAFVSIRNGDAHIFVVGEPGSDRALTRGQSVNTQPSWSPDGLRLAFTSTRDGLTKIYLMEADGSAVRRLTRDDRIESCPSWSPDGKTIAYYSRHVESGQVDLRISDIADGGTTVISGNGLDKGPDIPVWSADSRKLAFLAANPKGRGQVWVVNRDGSDAREVSGGVNDRNKAKPSFSPDGRTVIYMADMRGSIAIMATDLGSGVSVNLTEGVTSGHESPQWSPDGRHIAFASTRDDPDRLRTDIFIMDADGGNSRNLTRHPHEDFNPHWSADGRTIVFTSLRTGTSQVFEVDLATVETRRITRNDSHDMEHATRPIAAR